MNMLKTTSAALLLATLMLGTLAYSPSASALQVTCTKVQACVNGQCTTYLVCDDGGIYEQIG